MRTKRKRPLWMPKRQTHKPSKRLRRKNKTQMKRQRMRTVKQKRLTSQTSLILNSIKKKCRLKMSRSKYKLKSPNLRLNPRMKKMLKKRRSKKMKKRKKKRRTKSLNWKMTLKKSWKPWLRLKSKVSTNFILRTICNDCSDLLNCLFRQRLTDLMRGRWFSE